MYKKLFVLLLSDILFRDTLYMILDLSGRAFLYGGRNSTIISDYIFIFRNLLWNLLEIWFLRVLGIFFGING